MNISVVIPTYNRSDLLLASVQSVLDQTASPIEVIIVDDYSTDNTKEIVESIKDDRVKYMLNSRKKGANGARNTGILAAKGEFIAFQDSDDIWLPEKLEKQSKYIHEHEGVDMCFCSLRFINMARGKVPKRKVKPEEMKRLLARGNFISTQTIFMKKEVATTNLFDENLKRYQDWDFVLRVADKHIIHHIDEVLVSVEVREDSISKKINEIEALKQFFEKYPDLAKANLINKALYNKVLYHTDGNKLRHLTQYWMFKLMDKLIHQKERI